jgi:excisionase family DNA binding protein
MSAADRPTLADFAGRDTLRVEEAGRVLGVSRDTAYRAVHSGEIPSFRVGKKLFVPKRALAAMLGYADSTLDDEEAAAAPAAGAPDEELTAA